MSGATASSLRRPDLTSRSALYAHKINTLLWSNVDQPEAWGFASEYPSITPAV